jgi:hypothetical protein
MRKLFLALLVGTMATATSAVTVERIGAVIDGQVITVSEVSQFVEIRFFPRRAESEDEHRREVLEALIAQSLRLRDVERFGAADIPLDSIESRLREIQGRFASPAEFEAAVARAELTLDEVNALIKRQLQVEEYIRERFNPLVFVPNEDIETYYRTTWRTQRRERGLSVPPLDQVRDEIRQLLQSTRLTEEIERWTSRLRLRANVDIFAWR